MNTNCALEIESSTRISELRELLGQDVLLLQWPLGSKGTPRKWGHLTIEAMNDPRYLERLSTGNVGVALGEKSGHLCVVDVDVDELVEPFLSANPHLANTLQTHGARGRVFWMRMRGNYPGTFTFKSRSGLEAGEFRSHGSQSIISGRHPSGQPYQVVNHSRPVVVEFENLNLPNLTNVDYSGGTVSTPSVYLAYDVLNRLTNMVDAVGTTVYSYDSVGQLLSEAGPWASDTVSYTYTNRLRMGLSLSQPGGSWSQTYGYDVTRRLTNVTSQAGSFGYQYPGSGPSTLVTRLTLPNGATITNIFDSVARMLSTKLLNSSATILDSESYAYNQAGQRTVETNTAGDFRNYTYDKASELTSAIGKEAGGTTNRWQEQLGYAYDAAGNLNYRTNNNLLGVFSVNDLNELTTVTNGGRLTVAGTTTTPATSVTVNTSNAVRYADNAFASTNQPWTNGNNSYTAVGQDSYGRVSSNSVTVSLQATNTYSYDTNGNLTSDGTRNFAYDDENQLIGVSVADVYSNSFVYDGKLRRRIEKDFEWQGGAWVQTNEVHFIYDGNVVTEERNAGNNPLVTYTRSGSSLLARIDYGQEIPGSPTTAFYHTDGNGNVTMLIYNNQIIAAKYLYDPFGNTLSMSGPLASLNVYRIAS
ncbi:MAG: bifunctional DNA primase/polymerase, partial [Verrucomicrobiia bacterium]